MRHLVRGRKLGRTASHRKATLTALSVALIKSEKIVTTLAKAKALRSYVEPIITRSKEDSTHNRSHVFRHLKDKQATSRLFDEIAQMVEDRPGGYTRIIKIGPRKGDGAEMALIELVDFNDAKPEVPGKKRRRTRRGGAGGRKADAGKTVESSKQEAEKETGVVSDSVEKLKEDKDKDLQGTEKDLQDDNQSLDKPASSDESESQTESSEQADKKELVSDAVVAEDQEAKNDQPEDTTEADQAVSGKEKKENQDVKDQSEEKNADDSDDSEKKGNK